MATRSFIYLVASFMTVMATEEKQDSNVTPASIPPRPLEWTDFTTEIAIIGFLFLYVVVWWQGSRTNRDIASKWANINVDYLTDQFALAGHKTTNDKPSLVKDGPADYLMYTSGRRYIQFGHWWVKLKPRNDPVSRLTSAVFSLFGLAKPLMDRVEVTLTLDKEPKNKFVFAILNKSIAKETHEKRFDLSKMTKVASANVPSNLVIYTESQKLADLLLGGKSGDILRQSSGLESLIVTYLPDYEPERLNTDKDLKLTLTYDINDPKSSSLVELPCALADTVGSVNLPADVTTKLQKNIAELRKTFAKREAEDRAEEIAKKKAEAKRAQDDRLKKLSPSEQRKHDEKERNREKKKEMKKRTKRA
ncbi:unnamed protein product [Absidia cylindrospora]